MADRPTATLETTHCRQFPSLHNYIILHLELGFEPVPNPWNIFVEVMVALVSSFPRQLRQSANWTASEFLYLRVPNQSREWGISVHPTMTQRNITGPLPDCWEKGCTRFKTHGIPLTKNEQGGDSTYAIVLLMTSHLLGTFLKNFIFVFYKQVRKLHNYPPDLKTNLNVWRLFSITWINIM